MKRPFVAVTTGESIASEWEQLTSPYQQQQDLLELLRVCWDHNAAILRNHGHFVPKDWTGTPQTLHTDDPSLREAHHVLAACHDLWKAIWSKDLFRIANAGFWLGRMTAGDQFRQYQARISGGPRSEEKEQARAFYQAHRPQSARHFHAALVKEKGLEKVTWEQARNWYTDFKKYLAT